MSKVYEIKEFKFEVNSFTAYESIILASDLASVIGKIVKKYEKDNFMSLFDGISDIPSDKITNIITKITAKVKYNKLSIDLDSSFWSGKNLYVIFELCYNIVKDEYSDFLVESGLGELLEIPEPQTGKI